MHTQRGIFFKSRYFLGKSYSVSDILKTKVLLFQLRRSMDLVLSPGKKACVLPMFLFAGVLVFAYVYDGDGDIAVVDFSKTTEVA